MNEKTVFYNLRKGKVVFEKGKSIPGDELYVLIGTDLVNADDEKVYTANSVL